MLTGEVAKTWLVAIAMAIVTFLAFAGLDRCVFEAAWGHDVDRRYVPADSNEDRCVPGVADLMIREEDAEKWDKARAYLAEHGVECFGAAKNVWTCVRKCD